MMTSSDSYSHVQPLSIGKKCLYTLASFIFVAFGQPALIPYFGLLAAFLGYALFFRVVICNSRPSTRFWLASAWFFSVQLVQLSWFISHPFLYIYAVYFFLAALFAVQFGMIGVLINPKMVKNLWRCLVIASIWSVFEWMRLYLLSGFSFNPVGMGLAGNPYSLQMASLWGVFGLSLWVIFTNLLMLRAWLSRWKITYVLLWLFTALCPYVYGVAHIKIHEALANNQEKKPIEAFKAVLVQTAFPVEESIEFKTYENMVEFVIDEWRQILTIIKKHEGRSIDLLALPEFVVPYGTWANVYPLHQIIAIFRNEIGMKSLKKLPSPGWPLGAVTQNPSGEVAMVSNAYLVQAIANIFNTSVIVGLEDVEDMPNGQREYYSAALLFKADNESSLETNPIRYEKRVLVPMGEYIPFSLLQELAKNYGVFGSFTPGKEAKVMNCGITPLSPSICYEETFGDIMREGRQKGAEMFINLTSDVWYPNSRLPLQHLEHARLRTVENGIPLLRSCNTGITAAIDCLGRTISVLGGNEPEKVEWVPDSLYVEVPTYTYHTLYSGFGDSLIVGFCLLTILISFSFRQLFIN